LPVAKSGVLASRSQPFVPLSNDGMNAPLPPDERKRLETLRRYAILDTPREAAFERISRLAARLLKVPVVLVSLVDEDRQWFKSAYGIDVRETHREMSFCAHAILGDGIMVVPDATQDERFGNNALVIGYPHIRFYAGVPLASADDFKLGTFCAIDRVPRQFSAEEQDILRDLAEMVTDELELRLAIRERKQQAVAITTMKSGVLVTDPNEPNNPIIFCNPAFSHITGYDPEEVIGRNCRFLQGPETDSSVVQAIREAIAKRETFQGVVVNYRKDGSSFYNELSISPVLDQEGKISSFVGLQRDITERKYIADQLQQSYEKLQELETLRDDLTNMIIHDLRSPLTSVIGFMDLLHGSAAEKLGQEDMELIERAQQGAYALKGMITSLLDVKRLESGQMPLDLKECDLVEITKEAADSFTSVIGSRSFILDLPNSQLYVYCDAILIRRVVTNLVGNALKFTPENGEVRISVVSHERGAKVLVSDTGPGIPAECHAKIFEKFGQVEGHKHQHSTGLGLAFCKLSVEAHGGTIGVESEIEKGSTFCFVLPKRNGAHSSDDQ
jgi:PAS domain S-box-containing protein